MMRKTNSWLVVTLILSLGACVAARGVRQTRTTPDKRVTVLVASEGTLQPSVQVHIITKHGVRTLIGLTDRSGAITLDRDALAASNAVCLLFEKEGFFTGAIWLPGYDFGEPEYLALAKFALL